MRETRYCTIPALFNLRKWYEKKFGDLCEQHDHVYYYKIGTKWDADWEMTSGMWNRGYRLLSIVTFFFLWTVGIYYWYESDV